jgi:hypothetical protein
MKKELEVCPACETGHLRLVRKRGRRMPLRQIPDLEIPADVPIPTCDHCGAEILGEKDLAVFGNAMKAVYAQALQTKTEAAIRAIARTTNQRELERLIGVSAGYISKLKNAQSEPSGPLAALLMLLADEPWAASRLRTLWSMKVPVTRARWEGANILVPVAKDRAK